jgi:hypothetical protein
VGNVFDTPGLRFRSPFWGWTSGVGRAHVARIALTGCVLLFSASIQAQDRGDPLAPDGVGYEESSDPAPAAPRRRRNAEGDEWSRGSEDQSGSSGEAQPRASTRDETSAPAPAAQAPEPPASDGRARVRRRADFDGPDWDQQPVPQMPDRPGEIKGSFRFALQLTLVGYESLAVESEVSQIALERETVTAGLSESAGAGLAIGLGLSDHFVLNAAIVFGYDSLSFGESTESDQLRFQLLPNLEYVFGRPESHVRPFLAGVLGLLVGDVPTTRIDFHELSFLLAGQVGLHVFPNEHISIDPTLLIGYRVGSATGDLGTGMKEDYGIHGLVILLGFGSSFWS